MLEWQILVWNPLSLIRKPFRYFLLSRGPQPQKAQQLLFDHTIAELATQINISSGKLRVVPVLPRSVK